MAGAMTLSDGPLAPVDGPPRILFTRMTPAPTGCCVQCASPRMFVAEDSTATAWRLLAGRRGIRPRTYLQCGSCGSRDQSED